MLTHKHRAQWTAPALIVVLLVVMVGALLFLNGEPEHRRFVSPDGAVTVEGLFPSGVTLDIAEDKGASLTPWTAVISPVYVIEPDDVVLPSPVTVTFCILCDTHPIGREIDDLFEHAFIGYYDVSRGLWVSLESERDKTAGTLSTQTTHFSHWALLYRNVIMSSADKEALINDALEAAPTNANAYSIDLAYAMVEGDFVLLEEGVVADRCDETIVGRSARVTTVLDRPFIVTTVSGARSATLRAVIHWDTGLPCPDLLQ